MTRETYGVKTLQKALTGLFFGQGIGLIVTVFALLVLYIPVESGFIAGAYRGLPLMALPGPFVVTYLIWKQVEPSRFFTVLWCIASVYLGLLYFDRWTKQPDVLGFLLAIPTFVLPVLGYIIVLLGFEVAKIRKYGFPQDSVYRGD